MTRAETQPDPMDPAGTHAGFTSGPNAGFDAEESAAADVGTVHIDCDDCAVRGHGCSDCVVSVLLGTPVTLLADERLALEVLADAGLAPRLRLVPIHRRASDGVA